MIDYHHVKAQHGEGWHGVEETDCIKWCIVWVYVTLTLHASVSLDNNIVEQLSGDKDLRQENNGTGRVAGQ